jgi:dihydrolipoamide dehydrogenase
VARVITNPASAKWGLTYGEPKIDLDKMRSWKNKVIQKLTGGLGALTKKRKINYVQGPRQIPQRLQCWSEERRHESRP